MNTLALTIRAHAVKNIGGKYNFPQFKEEKERLMLRKKVCEELVELSDTHDVPLSFLVYFAVDKQSHRPCNFEKNFAKFNKDKALAIIQMAKEFATHHGYKKPNDKVYHALCGYYERCTTDHDAFTSVLNTMEANNKFATAKDIMKALGMVFAD